MNFIKNQASSRATRGLFVASGAVSPVEIAARCGFDWLLLDMEHGLGGEEATLRQITALAGSLCAPVVRLPAFRPELVKRLLDFGAAGLMAPMIGSADEARALVEAMRYPPEGIRGLSSGTRAAGYGFGFREYFERANRELLCVVQIETCEAVEHVGEIAAVDGVDVLFIGHSDLSLNLGVYGQFDSQTMLEAEEAVLAAAKRYGKIPGMLLKPGMPLTPYLEKGFRFLALGTDHGCMKQAFSALLDCYGV